MASISAEMQIPKHRCEGRPATGIGFGSGLVCFRVARGTDEASHTATSCARIDEMPAGKAAKVAALPWAASVRRSQPIGVYDRLHPFRSDAQCSLQRAGVRVPKCQTALKSRKVRAAGPQPPDAIIHPG